MEEICAQCGTRFKTSAKLDFLGFRESTCPACQLRVVTPLRWSYRIGYFVFLCLWTLALIQTFRENDGNLAGVAAICLWISYILRAMLKDLKVVYQNRILRQQPG